MKKIGPLCGCQYATYHEPGCLWHLDEDSREALHQALLADPFPAPRLSLDVENTLIVRIRQERETARLALQRFNLLFRLAAWAVADTPDPGGGHDVVTTDWEDYLWQQRAQPHQTGQQRGGCRHDCLG